MLPQNRTPDNAVRTAIYLEVVGLNASILQKIPRRKLAEEDIHYTGFTKFSSATVLAGFFRCGLRERMTAIELGYSTNGNACVAERIGNIQQETRNLYEAYRDFHRSGHVPQSLAWILDPERKKRKVFGKNRRNISVRICHEMIAYHMGSRVRAALRTGVPRSTIRFWLNLGYKE